MIEDIFSNYDVIFNVIKMIVFFVLSIVLFIKTKDLKYLEDIVKYKTEHTKNNSVAIGFETFKPVYKLNKVTNELEMTDEVVDIQELVNSCKDTCLQAVLDRFMPVDENVDVTSYNSMIDDLDVLQGSIDLAEEYRSKFNLPLTMSIQDVYKTVQDKSVALKTKIDMEEKKFYEKKEIKQEDK